MSEPKRAHEYPKIGEEPQDGDPPGVYCMLIEEHISALNPRDYFITSGEAVAKAEKLNKDIWAMAGKARKLLNQLKVARGDAKYLECTMEGNGIVICRCKNPRSKTRKAAQAKAKAKAKANVKAKTKANVKSPSKNKPKKK